MSFLIGKKTMCLITGASRGIGAAIAQALAKECADGSTFILLARKEKELLAICESISGDEGIKKTHPVIMDLANPNFEAYKNLFLQYKGNKFDQAILVHNAATIGPMDKKVSQLEDAKEIREYFESNFNSMVLLTTAFLQSFSVETIQSRIIVNISSGAAYGAVKGMHLYSAAKAARDGYFRVVAAEEPTIRILNFNPGPIVTDMQSEVQSQAWSEDVKIWSRDGVNSSSFPTPAKAAGTLVKILNHNQYESGCFINIHEKVLHFDYRPSCL